MTIKLGTSIASLQGIRQLERASDQLATVFERLSSGQRINRASDDAAGLALADGLKADAIIQHQAVRNLNDGISLLNLAESSLAELTDIVSRIQELTQQSLNGTYTKNQKETLDFEAQALADEYSRIVTSTEYNSMKLFSGDNPLINLQAGIGSDAVLSTNVGGAVGTGQFEARVTFGTLQQPTGLSVADVNADGLTDILIANSLGTDSASVYLNSGAGSFNLDGSYGAAGQDAGSVETGDFNGDGYLDLVNANFTSNTIVVRYGDANGAFGNSTTYGTGDTPIEIATGDFNNDGLDDIVTTDLVDHTASVFISQGENGFGSRTVLTTSLNPEFVSLGDVNNDGNLDIVTSDYNGSVASTFLGNGDGSFQPRVTTSIPRVRSAILADFNNDGNLDLAGSSSNNSRVDVWLGDGTGSFGNLQSFAVGGSPQDVRAGDFNGDGILDLAVANRADDTVSVAFGVGNGSFVDTLTLAGGDAEKLEVADVNGDGVLDIITADAGDDTVSIHIARTTFGATPLLEFSIATTADARQALPVFTRKLDQLSAQRAEIGAYVARIESAKNVLSVNALNLEAAESQIRSADVAEDSARLVRNTILQKAAVAMLAQANLQPQIALELLR